MGFWLFGGNKKQKAIEVEKKSLYDNAIAPKDGVVKSEKVATGLAVIEPKSPIPQKRPGKRFDRTRRISSYGDEPSQLAPWTQQQPLYAQNITSQSSIGPEQMTVSPRPPTLHRKRPEQTSSITRTRSSKRKADDYERERVVRAISASPLNASAPRRPASFHDSGPLSRETRTIPGNPNRKLHRPASQVSLPASDAMSGFEGPSPQNSFKIGVFAALSPRPTVKYDASLRYARGKQASRTVGTPKSTILEETPEDDRARIDDLADSLDARALHELMDRDRRRRERKKDNDKTKLERKLQRRADREREEEERKKRVEAYVSDSKTHLEARDIELPTSPLTEEVQPLAGSSGIRTQTQNPFADPLSPIVATPAVIRNPFEDEKDEDIMQEPVSSPDEPVVPARSPLRIEQTSKGYGALQQASSPSTTPVPLAGRQSISQGSLLNRETTDELGAGQNLDRRASDQSSQVLGSWTSFFKRGTRRKLSASAGRSTPSEFSNTSRESMVRRPMPPAVVTRTFRPVDAVTPQRTMSKFREDLPELPISPPDSRVQSPQAGARSAVVPAKLSSPLLVADPDAQSDLPVDEPSATSAATRPDQNKAVNPDGPSGAVAEVVPQSLGSVDSEGSWLAGRALEPLSGTSSQRPKLSTSSLSRPILEATTSDESSNKDLGASIPPPDSVAMQQRQQPPPQQREGETWHSGLGRQPTLIRQASRAKSKEGLLNEYTAREPRDNSPDYEDQHDHEDESPEREEDKELQAAPIMRARSVEYKTHVRHISAGSARLLEIRPSSIASELSLFRAPGLRRDGLMEGGSEQGARRGSTLVLELVEAED